MTDLWNKTVTVYNSIPAEKDIPRSFCRAVIKKCFCRSELTSSSADTTVEKRTSHPRLRTKDISGYLPPESYYSLSEKKRANKYTVQIGDFIVFGEVDDMVTNAAEYAELQQRYRERGFRVTSVSVNIHGLNVDHIAVS